MFVSGAVILAAAVAAAATPPLVVDEPFFGTSRAYTVETRAHRFFADAGESGPTFDVSAMISVLVTRDGAPVSDLGASVPMSGGAIALPPAFTLRTSFVAPPGPLGIGCLLDPTAFTNHGNGIYTIRVVPLIDSPVCRWGLGDYHYVVSVARGSRRGSGLGVLTVPDSPSVP
jgi:hypothetical protein